MDDRSANTVERRGRGCPWGRAGRDASEYPGWADDPASNRAPRSRPWESLGAPDIRVSDLERSAVAQDLGKHFAAGRLDMAEFDERTGRAFGARTRQDLAGLLSDLPPLGSPLQERRRTRGPRPWMLLAVMLAIVAALSVSERVLRSPSRFLFPLVPDPDRVLHCSAILAAGVEGPFSHSLRIGRRPNGPQLGRMPRGRHRVPLGVEANQAALRDTVPGL